MISYFKGVWREAKKVQWPDAKTLRKLTLTVLGFCGIFAVIFILMDLLINTVFKAMGL